MKAPWSLQDNWIAFKNQMEEGVIYGQYSGAPVPDYQVVDIAIRLILDTGLFEVEYGQWIARPENRKKWSHMKEFWPSKMEIKRTTMSTATKQGIGMLATANDVDAAYAVATTNFSEAHQVTQTAVSNLMTSNAA